MALFYFCSENGTSGESNQIPPLNADREVVRTHTPLNFVYMSGYKQDLEIINTIRKSHTYEQ